MNWLLDSCRTTIVIENTTAVNEIIACTMADRNDRAPSGGPGNNSAPPDGRSLAPITISATASPADPATHSAGTSYTCASSKSATRLRDTTGSRSRARLARPATALTLPTSASSPHSRIYVVLRSNREFISQHDC